MAFARIMQARLVGSIHGQETVNVMNFGTDAAAADNDALVALLVALATAIIECAIASLLPAVSSDWILDHCDAKQLFPAVSDPVEVSPQANDDNQGTQGAINTSMDTVMMRIRTGGGGKSGRGRNFLPPPGDAAITQSILQDQVVKDFYAQFLACLAGKFIGAGKTTDFSLGVLSRKWVKDHPGDFPGGFRPATEVVLETRTTKLISRKVGHGG